MPSSRFGRIDRRRLVASAVVGGAAVLAPGEVGQASPHPVAPVPLVAQDGSSDVPMFRGNAARTGEMFGPGPDDANGVEAIWTFAIAGGIWSSPAVVDGVVYFGSDNASIYALNAVDGTERWRFAAGSFIVMSSPAVVDGMVYVGSHDGNLYAVSAEDGTERWRFVTDGPIDSSPAVVDGVVYFGSLDTNLYAVDSADGVERWRFTTGAGVISSPAIVDGVVYVGGLDANLYAVNASDGMERWRFATGDTIFSTPSIVDGVVYVGSHDTNLYAVNASDGMERWRFATGARIFSPPAVADGVAYLGIRDNDHNDLYAVNASDGMERWRSEHGSSLSPVVVDGVVYVESYEFFAIDMDSGLEQWRIATGAGISTSPAVVNGVVYLGANDGMLYAIGARVPRLGVGGTARVTETTALRGGPAPTAVERAELQPDTVVTITGESESAGDAVWWPVSVNETGEQGWVEALNLEPLTSGPDPESTP